MGKPREQASFVQALLPIGFLACLIGYGLIIRPLWLDQTPFPLEIIFILAAAFTVAQLMLLGHSWNEIQKTIVAKLASALPAFFILFSIGLIISSWIVCGTIPMLVYYGLKVIDPGYLYLIAFLAPVIFSSLTGTSWGSVGTIGVVIISIAQSLDANLGITAGAVIGGAYFGDKMSPLSDTTNLAALAAEVDLFDHIRSMMYSTIPSAIMAAVCYFVLGFVFPPQISGSDLSSLQPQLDALSNMFNFNLLLLIPPIVVVIGSLRKMPTVPVLLTSILSACLLAPLFQRFSITDVIASVHKGFNSDMATWMTSVPDHVQSLVNRGGLYALNEAIITAFMVFIFIGALDHIRAMPIVVNALLKGVRSCRGTVVINLIATGFTNAMTSNQYATSFIVGDAFKSKYDQMKIPRPVLSRSLEDTGTMIESIIPWTATSLFMVSTLGVAFADYWHWQLLSLINIVVAFLLAITGIGCFYPRDDSNDRPN